VMTRVNDVDVHWGSAFAMKVAELTVAHVVVERHVFATGL
jgi:hypothetical protein